MNEKQKMIFPAEWHKQCAVMLTWAHSKTDWYPYLDDINNTLVELTKTISKYEKVLIVAQNDKEVTKLLENNIDESLLKNIVIIKCNTNDTWARDHAFITLISEDTSENKKTLFLDFKFNGWGKKFAAQHDNNINENIKQKNILKGEWQDNNDFVLEGGSIESDGQGTVFTTSVCLLAPNRNEPLSKEEIEARLKLSLHANRIVWLDYGQLIGDDTDGHIDTIVRVAPNNTLIYVGCQNSNDPQFEEFKKLENQLTKLRNNSGAPYNLLKLPMPTPIYDEGERLPATYANFLIINNAVIVPTYNQPQNDQKAIEIIKKAFPDRKIIGIDSRTVIRQHGSLHCLTMQIPQEAKL